MESLLRGEKESVVISKENPVLFFPVRHHSPACSFHLKRAMEAYEPDCVLIEGPQNAQDMIPTLTHEETTAPVALYYFYKDSKGLLSEEKEGYRCYYPFLNYSPELAALREAAALGVPARFIDLSYGEILLGTAENKGLRQNTEKQTYNDDYLLSRSRYLTLLCEKTGLRDFEEFWEKYFEIGGLSLKTTEFIHRMYTYCCLAREHTPGEEMEADGCLLRERYMAEQIAAASREFKRILVVTGGFHTKGLQQLLGLEGGSVFGSFGSWVDGSKIGSIDSLAEGHMSDRVSSQADVSKLDHVGSLADDSKPGASQGEECVCRALTYQGEPVKLHNLAPEDQGVYPLAYSMEAADALNGYASGMQSPGFYELVWKQITGENPYTEAVLHQLISSGRQARQKKENISSYDVICALSMAQGLAALRGKEEPGLYELRDAALSSFVKGECNPSTDLPLRILAELNTGRQVGKLPSNALRPPILSDFEEKCRKFHLKLQFSVKQDVTLEIFTKKRHLELSRFFYQMNFLKTEFAQRKKGSDLVNRRDRSRIRETWSYRFSSHILSALIDVSTFGGTVEEAAKSQLRIQFAKSTSFRESARLMTEGFLMGFLEEESHMGDHAEHVLAADGDFFSLSDGFSHLRMLYELQELYQVEDGPELEALIGDCFQKIAQLLPSMAQISAEQEQQFIDCCLSLYQITSRLKFSQFRPVFLETLHRLLGQQNIQPGVEGAAMGLIYGCDGSFGARIQETASGYLTGTGEKQKKSAAYLRGLFCTARDMVFTGERFLAMIDELLGNLSAEAFMALLPEFRRAFGYFTPLETDRIAREAAQLHGVKKKELLGGRIVSPLELEYGQQLDAYGRKRMTEVSL